MAKDIYANTTIPANQKQPVVTVSRAYRGISTVADNNSFALYDIALIKQDIINHFHIRQGEKLENPEFGCIIWDLLFDPLTDNLRDIIAQNVTEIINYDPRVKVDQIIVSQFEMGLQVECVLTYLPYNIAEALTFRFDENNNMLA